MLSPKPISIFEHIKACGDDHGFRPRLSAEPTDLPPGSPERVALMAARAERGEPIFVEGDRSDFAGLVGAIQPTNIGRRDLDTPWRQAERDKVRRRRDAAPKTASVGRGRKHIGDT